MLLFAFFFFFFFFFNTHHILVTQHDTFETIHSLNYLRFPYVSTKYKKILNSKVLSLQLLQTTNSLPPKNKSIQPPTHPLTILPYLQQSQIYLHIKKNKNTLQ
eukprot:TRINITY_DN5323_c1_g1_i2.p7 TRINITY_DN5323_c1_g1~~TRINITY_DN5323_c1_g1_i2.p7  ORF type:complete len:103 (-),score=1.41 TRINITY_DN5323_c1_g1_i2:1540-1848(-)